MKVNLFDFDGTIYDGDSTVDFYKFCLKKKKRIIRFLPMFMIYALLYKLKIKSKTEMKEVFYKFLTCFDDIDREVKLFWQNNEKKIKEFYWDRKRDSDIIISASPYFLLKPVSDKLGVMDLIASNVIKETGKYVGENCHGEEKVRLLRKKYPSCEVIDTYTDSLSDKPILLLAKNGYMVSGNKIEKWVNNN